MDGTPDESSTIHCLLLFLCWIVHILISSCVLIIVKGHWRRELQYMRNNYGYCSWYMIQGSVGSLYTVMYFSLDITSLGFMVWASSTIVLFCADTSSRSNTFAATELSPRLLLWPEPTLSDPGKLLCTFYTTYDCFDNLDDSSCKPRAVDGEHLCLFGHMFSSIPAPLCSLSRTLSYLSVLLPVGQEKHC